jgi:AraC family ethanolamine operon transcriptional activator
MTTTEHRQLLVDRVSQILRDRVGEGLRIGDLPDIAGVSERTLRNAFHHVHGLSPKQFDLRERLQRARRALCDRAPGCTVTGVASEYGFFEFGRFSSTYRRMFGESPSQTIKSHSAGPGSAIQS